jgi:hypothetical protein
MMYEVGMGVLYSMVYVLGVAISAIAVIVATLVTTAIAGFVYHFMTHQED